MAVQEETTSPEDPSVAFWDSGVKDESTLPSGSGEGLRTINQTFSDHPWDVVWIGSPRRALPGICKIMDGGTEIGIDAKNPDGKDGAAITVKGYRPGPFEISCTVWTARQWVELLAVLEAIWRRPNKELKTRQVDGRKTTVSDIAVGVYHPALEMYGITSCVVKGPTFPTDGPFDGARTVRIKCVQNVPPGKKRQTKTATTGDDSRVAPEVNASASSPLNVKPIPPSKNKKALGPRGAPIPPANGST